MTESSGDSSMSHVCSSKRFLFLYFFITDVKHEKNPLASVISAIKQVHIRGIFTGHLYLETTESRSPSSMLVRVAGIRSSSSR